MHSIACKNCKASSQELPRPCSQSTCSGTKEEDCVNVLHVLAVFCAVQDPTRYTRQALAASTNSNPPQYVELAAHSPASFSLHGSRLVLRMMKALVVVFPTSSLSNTMPSCRICRHRVSCELQALLLMFACIAEGV